MINFATSAGFWPGKKFLTSWGKGQPAEGRGGDEETGKGYVLREARAHQARELEGHHFRVPGLAVQCGGSAAATTGLLVIQREEV